MWLRTTRKSIASWFARKLEFSPERALPYTHTDLDMVRAVLEPGDVILVEGYAPVSRVIKYFTQSTFSHAAMYVGSEADLADDDGNPLELIEVLMSEGCIAVPLAKYERYNIRICRACNLRPEDRQYVTNFMIDSIGVDYDLKNILDMVRFAMLPRPPVPLRWRRQMLSFGMGDPTRAICSSLIAKAYQSVRYPILPKITHQVIKKSLSEEKRKEMWSIRHHSLFTPRDFDLSPYFYVVKPTLENGFDYRQLEWTNQFVAPDDAIYDKEAGESAA